MKLQLTLQCTGVSSTLGDKGVFSTAELKAMTAEDFLVLSAPVELHTHGIVFEPGKEYAVTITDEPTP